MSRRASIAYAIRFRKWSFVTGAVLLRSACHSPAIPNGTGPSPTKGHGGGADAAGRRTLVLAPDGRAALLPLDGRRWSDD